MRTRSPMTTDAAEEAAAALANVETDFGRTTDPVRMYMREMGTVELLTREGEIAIAKRIEEGIRCLIALSISRTIGRCSTWLRQDLRRRVSATDVIVGFIDRWTGRRRSHRPAANGGRQQRQR